jgi:hypothetical protein
MGVTDYAQKALGDVVFVELPDISTVISAGGEPRRACTRWVQLLTRALEQVKSEPSSRSRLRLISTRRCRGK